VLGDGDLLFLLPMLAAHPLAHLNAALNLTAAVLLLLGYAHIRCGREQAHRRTMLAAFGVSVAFLTSYVIYHIQEGSVKFTGAGTVRLLYFVLLGSHILLAFSVVFLVPVTVYLGLRDRRAAHRRLAHWTFPIWLYVSITGVLVYLMLYYLYPAGQS